MLGDLLLLLVVVPAGACEQIDAYPDLMAIAVHIFFTSVSCRCLVKERFRGMASQVTCLSRDQPGVSAKNADFLTNHWIAWGFYTLIPGTPKFC